MTGRARRWVLGTVTVAVLFGLLQLVVASGVVSRQEVPLPSLMVVTLLQQLGTGAFWAAVGTTAEAWAVGLLVAVAVGVPLGLLIGSSYLGYRAARAPVEFLRPIPAVALIPLAVLIDGIGIRSTILLAAFGALWPVLVQAIYGARDVDPVARETARCFGLGRLYRFWHIVVPSALPSLATGVRIGAAVALILAVTAELVIGGGGLGSAIASAQSGDALRLMYALVLATGVLGLVINVAFRRGQRHVLHWHSSERVGVR